MKVSNKNVTLRLSSDVIGTDENGFPHIYYCLIDTLEVSLRLLGIALQII